MNTPEVNPEGYRESAPINFAEGLKCDLLIIHGTGNNNTPAPHQAGDVGDMCTGIATGQGDRHRPVRHTWQGLQRIEDSINILRADFLRRHTISRIEDKASTAIGRVPVSMADHKEMQWPRVILKIILQAVCIVQ